VVNAYSEEELRTILREYGEESYAASIARNIVRKRAVKPLETCRELEETVEASVPAKYRYNACARKTFQAIRIEVNGELNGLSKCVTALTRRLNPNGRGCVITFHSLEDRIVKQAFRDLATGCTCPKEFPVCVCGRKQEIELVGRKPLTAGEEELKENSRSKSAKLRIVRKLPT
ncbi:MAG: 16S rRNA (cytosine(1402)-N(4))-methyltransferase RsmH, partial [Clostridia bacterium]|nr:16S rRNA (cytosine(1402)-N(4))-methyltransferase RsmH [Clostridia bacterium]